jgi:hypothetical protein
MLAAQYAGNLGREATEDQAIYVDDAPDALELARFG